MRAGKETKPKNDLLEFHEFFNLAHPEKPDHGWINRAGIGLRGSRDVSQHDFTNPLFSTSRWVAAQQWLSRLTLPCTFHSVWLRRLVMLLASSGVMIAMERPSPIVGPESPASRGHHLAQIYCVTCHSLPVPGHLDRATWRDELLPKMRYLTGLEPPPTNGYFKDLDLLIAAGVFPKSPLIPRAVFDDIAAYYLQSSVERDPVQPATNRVVPPLTKFTVLLAPS